jgi:tetratricopeptide (TPR) repeat protein
MFSRLEHSSDRQARSSFTGARAALRRAEGSLTEALADAELTIEIGRTFGGASQSTKQGVVEALEASFALGETAKVEELVGSIEAVPLGSRSPYLDAEARRFRAKLAQDEGGFDAAAERFRDLRLPFHLAVALLEHGERFLDQGQPGEAEPLLAEAVEVFEQLAARPWLERARRLASTDAVRV